MSRVMVVNACVWRQFPLTLFWGFLRVSKESEDAIGREAVRVVCLELVRCPQQLHWVGPHCSRVDIEEAGLRRYSGSGNER